MQKVSKQSLAMIALSILLAISIALTFTFAALQDSKTAKGTITFAGEASVTLSGGTVTGNVMTFNLSNDDFTFKTIEGKTTASVIKTKLDAYKIQFSNSSKVELTWKIELASTNNKAVVTLATTGLTGTLEADTAGTAVTTDEIKLSNVVAGIEIADADNFGNETFEIKAEIKKA